jgi:GntR family histidine utilization transcriptional repressor
MTLTLHERIRTDIEGKILSGQLSPGDRIPIEHDLMRIYGCSRMTVNKAVSALAAAGLVERRRRFGTIVARPRVHAMIIDVPDLPTEVSRRGKLYAFRLLSRRTRKPRRGDLAEQELAAKANLLEVTGLHLADAVPLAFEHRLVSLAKVPDIADADLSASPPGTWLLQHVPWTDAATRIAAIGADAEHAEHLGLAAGTPCLSIERRTWRGPDQITLVRQTFVGSAFDLSAQFSHEAARARGAV